MHFLTLHVSIHLIYIMNAIHHISLQFEHLLYTVLTELSLLKCMHFQLSQELQNLGSVPLLMFYFSKLIYFFKHPQDKKAITHNFSAVTSAQKVKNSEASFNTQFFTLCKKLISIRSGFGKHKVFFGAYTLEPDY